MKTTELFKGNLQTIILKIIADHGKMYGYEIAYTVKDLSEGNLKLTEGALYPTLKRMEKEKLLRCETVVVRKRTRKYYSLTTKGKNLTQAKVLEFISFVKTMAFVMNIRVA